MASRPRCRVSVSASLFVYSGLLVRGRGTGGTNLSALLVEIYLFSRCRQVVSGNVKKSARVKSEGKSHLKVSLVMSGSDQ